MAKNNDDLADALAALAAGNVADDHDAHHSSGVQHAHDQTTPAPPGATPKPPAVAPKAATPRPAAPAARPPAPTPAVPARPASPARPATPSAGTARPAAPPPERPAALEAQPAPAAANPPARVRPAAPSRPAAPNLTPPPLPPVEEAAEEQVADDPDTIYDDGDAVIVPAPSADVFRNKPKPAPKPKKPNYTSTLEFKQTIIPVMLTLGVVGLISAGLPFVVPSSSGLAMLRSQGLYLGLFAISGAMFLAFAGLNILQVKSVLESQKRRK